MQRCREARAATARAAAVRERERELWKGAGGREQGRGRQGERWESGGCLVLDERESLRPATRLVRSCDYGRCVLELHSRARHWATAKNQRRTKPVSPCFGARSPIGAVRDLAGHAVSIRIDDMRERGERCRGAGVQRCKVQGPGERPPNNPKNARPSPRLSPLLRRGLRGRTVSTPCVCSFPQSSC